MAEGTENIFNSIRIKSGLRADIMRSLMETKNSLTALGSIYVGQGVSDNVGPNADPVAVYRTKELQTGGPTSFGKLLQVNDDGDLKYGYISAVNFGGVEGFTQFMGTYTLPVELDETTNHVLVNGNEALVRMAEIATQAYEAGHAQSADSAQTATAAGKSDKVLVDFQDERSDYATVKVFEFSTFSDFANSSALKTAMQNGAVVAAKLCWLDSLGNPHGSKNLTIIPGEDEFVPPGEETAVGGSPNAAVYPALEDGAMVLHAVSAADFAEHVNFTRIRVYTLG